MLPREQREPADHSILPIIRRTDAVVASGGTKETTMKTETMNTEIRELTDDELQNVSGGMSQGARDGLALALQGAMGPAGALFNGLVTTARAIKDLA